MPACHPQWSSTERLSAKQWNSKNSEIVENSEDSLQNTPLVPHHQGATHAADLFCILKSRQNMSNIHRITNICGFDFDLDVRMWWIDCAIVVMVNVSS